MRKPWSVASLWADSTASRSPPWHCQLVHTAREGATIVLDLVALEDCPVDDLPCPRHTPFTLHVGGDGFLDGRPPGAVRTWSDAADVVTIVFGVTTDGMSWMCLSYADRHLVLQL